MENELQNDLSMLRSYFCIEGELLIIGNIETSEVFSKFIIALNILLKNDMKLHMQVSINSPDIFEWFSDPKQVMFSIESTRFIDKNISFLFKNEILKKFRILLEIGEASLFNILSWVPEGFHKFWSATILHGDIEVPSTKKLCPETFEHVFACLFLINHIRCESRYFKFLKKAAIDFNVNVRLLRWTNVIYSLVLAENESNFKEFFKFYKSISVDINSQRKPCKERQINILERKYIPMSKSLYSHDFNVINFDLKEELTEYLLKYDLKAV